jgi:tRNA(Leu) C34 or U34 (ribose-2'-O)-methylase TrmL
MSQNSKETSYTQYAAVALQNPLNGFNIGGALRATGAYNGSFLVTSGTRYKSRNSDFRPMDAEMARKRMPVFLGVNDLSPFVPYDCEVVVIERDATSQNLVDFVHPRRALYVFGPEDGAVDTKFIPEGMTFHKVYIPSSYSLNLSACVYTVLYDRQAKSKIWETTRVICPTCGSDHTKELTPEESGVGYHCNACGAEWLNSAT